MIWILALVAAVLAIWFFVDRHPGQRADDASYDPPVLRHPPRMHDDPEDNLGRRKDDNAGGEA